MSKLIPVLEFEPWKFSSAEYPGPDDLGVARRYWFDCLAEAGIHGLEPYRDGSFFVGVDRVDEGAIEKLIQVTCDEGLDDDEHICPLDGGFALVHPDADIEPGCCCGFDDLDSWTAATREPASDWKMLWIGHPWVLYRWRDDVIEISEPVEDDTGKTIECRVRMPRSELSAAVESATSELDRFFTRLQSLLERSHPKERAHRIARLLIYGDQ